MIGFSTFILGFLIFRAGIASYNLLFPPTFSSKKEASLASLSILIPARDEEDSLPQLLDQLKESEHPDVEVIVLDDFSTDNTWKILQHYARSWDRLRVLQGKSLPSGWLGKNWACHQLSVAAKGEYLLFLDADVAFIQPSLPGRAIQELVDRNMTLLSIFPTQRMPTWGEKMVVPLMHYLLLSLLPLRWIYQLPFPSMAAANGQFMLFEGKTYRKHQWHRQVKGVIVEDIAIMQAIKQARLNGMTLLGQGNISCRMYRGYVSGIKGFGKNLLAGFGNQIALLILFILTTQIAWIVILPYLSPVQWGIALLAIAWMRFCTHQASREAFWVHLFLHPLQMFTLLLIAANSIYRKLSGKNLWKGRNVASVSE